MLLTWSHAVMYVRDEAVMLDFYTRVLGFEITDRGPLGEQGPDIIFLSQNPEEHHQLAMLPAAGRGVIQFGEPLRFSRY